MNPQVCCPHCGEKFARSGFTNHLIKAHDLDLGEAANLMQQVDKLLKQAQQPLFIQAIYNLQKRAIEFTAQGPTGIGTLKCDVQPEHFAGLMEYLETFWKSYCAAKAEGKV